MKKCRERADNHVLCVNMLLHVSVLVDGSKKERHAEKMVVVVVKHCSDLYRRAVMEDSCFSC